MVTHTKPKQTKLSDIKPEWLLIDAEGETLGRLASKIAVLLMGKHRSIYVPNLNTGDFVVVINANKIKVTGKKLEQKRYFNYSGYHGGIRERSLEDMLEKWPTEAVKHAVKGMLPKNTPGRQMLSRLKLYSGSEHPHEAQLNAGAKLARAAKAAVQAEPKKIRTKKNPSPKTTVSSSKDTASEPEVATVKTTASEKTKTARKSKASTKTKKSAKTKQTKKAPSAKTEND
jgi:large subunit ribosomal protein L13